MSGELGGFLDLFGRAAFDRLFKLVHFDVWEARPDFYANIIIFECSCRRGKEVWRHIYSRKWFLSAPVEKIIGCFRVVSGNLDSSRRNSQIWIEYLLTFGVFETRTCANIKRRDPENRGLLSLDCESQISCQSPVFVRFVKMGPIVDSFIWGWKSKNYIKNSALGLSDKDRINSHYSSDPPPDSSWPDLAPFEARSAISPRSPQLLCQAGFLAIHSSFQNGLLA